MEVRKAADPQKGFDTHDIKKVDDLNGRLDVTLLVEDEFTYREIVLIEKQGIAFV
jgi:hypothetical protein